jgi:hypothetical protein
MNSLLAGLPTLLPDRFFNLRTKASVFSTRSNSFVTGLSRYNRASNRSASGFSAENA